MINEMLTLSIKLMIVAWITSKRQLIHNKDGVRSVWNQSYDYIVVGAGAGGSVVANRLSEDPGVNVLLLEAGGPQNAIYNDIPALWTQITAKIPSSEWFYYEKRNGSDNYQVTTGGKTIGGSTSHNDGSFSRGNPRDYENWVHRYGAQGWSFRDVLPYFRKFENNTDRSIVDKNPGYHGTNGPVQISSPKNPDPILWLGKRQLNSMGFMDTDVNGPIQEGTMMFQAFIDQNGFRSLAGNAYLDPNPHPNNLHIVTNALVVKVLFNGRTAVGVRLIRNGTSFEVYARKEVILSAGKALNLSSTISDMAKEWKARGLKQGSQRSETSRKIKGDF